MAGFWEPHSSAGGRGVRCKAREGRPSPRTQCLVLGAPESGIAFRGVRLKQTGMNERDPTLE